MSGVELVKEVPVRKPEEDGVESQDSRPLDPDLPVGAYKSDVPAPMEQGTAAGATTIPPRPAPEGSSCLESALDALRWPELLAGRPGWRWNADLGGLECANDVVHKLQSVTVRGQDRTRTLRFLAPYLACLDCPHRTDCTSSTSRIYRKEVALAIPTEQAYPIHVLFAKSRGAEPPKPPSLVTRRRRRTSRPSRAPSPSTRGHQVGPEPRRAARAGSHETPLAKWERPHG